MIFHQIHNSLYNYNYNSTFYEDIYWRPHFHKNFEAICVLSGQVECDVNGKRAVLNAGEFGMCLSNEVHEYRSVGHSNCWIGVFSGDFVHAFENQVKDKAGSDFRFSCSDAVFRFLSETLIKPEIPDRMMLKSCLYALCSEYLGQISLSDRPENRDVLMFKIIDCVSKNFRSRLTLSDLAFELKYDYSYISRNFKKIFKMSFNDFLNSYRTEYALTLLTETDKSITTVAMESGFQSIRTFNDVFKKQLGRSPRSFR